MEAQAEALAKAEAAVRKGQAATAANITEEQAAIAGADAAEAKIAQQFQRPTLEVH
jgi:hypothetical protein